MLKIKTISTVLIVLAIFVSTTASMAPGNFRGAKITQNGFLTHSLKNAKAMCGLSNIVFKASDGKIYPGKVTPGSISDQRCTFSVAGVPAGTKGQLIAKLTLHSKNTYIYTCWIGRKPVTISTNSKPDVSSWSNHPDSLVGSGICK